MYMYFSSELVLTERELRDYRMQRDDLQFFRFFHTASGWEGVAGRVLLHLWDKTVVDEVCKTAQVSMRGERWKREISS